MKRLLSLLAFLSVALPAGAHFIWLVPNHEKRDVLMVFSDTTDPDENVPIKKIAQTKLFTRAGGKGDAVKFKMVEEKHAYRVTPEGDDVTMIAGSCQYGVIQRGKDEPFLLMYHAKAIIRSKGRAKEGSSWIFEPTPQLPFEIVPVEKKVACRVFWQGKPAADAEVVVLVPGVKKSIELKADAKGYVELPEPKAGGIYGIRAKFVETKEGELDGKKYKEIRHYATFTIPLLRVSVKP